MVFILAFNFSGLFTDGTMFQGFYMQCIGFQLEKIGGSPHMIKCSMAAGVGHVDFVRFD